MNILTKTVALVLATATLMLCDSTAFSADMRELHRKVSFADLNLNNPQGVRVLYRRLRSAANAVCEVSVYPRSATRPCVTLAMSNAVAQVNNANLTAYYNERAGHAVPEGAKVASDR